ncbi:Phospholipid hydroperoxide glutathione peroxidase, partial [Phytophthora palmivora]
MNKSKGKVVLAINLSRQVQEPRAGGAGVPFAGQEPGTHQEIVEFVKQYNVTFWFFEKHDVNGTVARRVFTYEKTKSQHRTNVVVASVDA